MTEATMRKAFAMQRLSVRLWWAAQRIRVRHLLARLATLMHPHIHTPGDGRGARRVFVDGRLVEPANYADTRAGFVRAFHKPPRVNMRRGVVRTYKVRGNVTVEFIP